MPQTSVEIDDDLVGSGIELEGDAPRRAFAPAARDLARHGNAVRQLCHAECRVEAARHGALTHPRHGSDLKAFGLDRSGLEVAPVPLEPCLAPGLDEDARTGSPKGARRALPGIEPLARSSTARLHPARQAFPAIANVDTERPVGAPTEVQVAIVWTQVAKAKGKRGFRLVDGADIGIVRIVLTTVVVRGGAAAGHHQDRGARRVYAARSHAAMGSNDRATTKCSGFFREPPRARSTSVPSCARMRHLSTRPRQRFVRHRVRDGRAPAVVE